MTAPATKTIPQPKPHFLVGNIPELADPQASILSMMRIAKEYGPIVKLQFPSGEMLIVSSQELVNELCDETRFDKMLHGPILQQRDIAGDALFTARTQEKNWGKAHRILMPAFGPASMRNMFDSMWDIAEQLLLKWERLPAGERIDVADNMTRLTLDAIALCAFSYRFNSFYQKDMHPFINAMVRNLLESGARSQRPALMTRLMFRKNRQRAEDIRLLHNTADEIIAQRKRRGEHAGTQDLLDLMLHAKDPKTGEGLEDTFIRHQLVQFLTAGHETTSGLLTFTFHLMLENPETLAKARAEVDRVLGSEPARFEHLSQLAYVDQCLKESLRLWPTAPAFAVTPYEKETTIGGGYPVNQKQVILVLLPALHRDKAVWGDDAERYDPDRFAPERFDKLPPNAWRAFGNGQRACIGRPFAMQEATLVLASVLQRFDIEKADPGYQLKIKQTLTIKPDGFFIKVKRRDVTIAPRQTTTATTAAKPSAAEAATGTPIKVLFGSNAGSSEAFAQRIATEAKTQGFAASLGTLDSAVGHLPREGAVVIVAASYEGHPTDNAKEFMTWLDGLGAGALLGVKFTVFGCGNKDWARTYQKIPREIDERMAAAGAERIYPRGEADARGDFFGDFDRWYANFWKTLAAAFGQTAKQPAVTAQFELEFIEGARDPLLRVNSLARGEVVENRELVDMTSPLGRSKRHIEILLPPEVKYRAGDYLSVLPSNPPESIGRVLRRYGLSYDAQVVLKATVGTQTFFPTGRPVLAGELLASFVELGQPATQSQIQKLAVATSDPEQKRALETFASGPEPYGKEILAKRVSVIDLMERFGSCELPFASLLQMLSPLKPRQYSISSSPLFSENHCSITVALVEGPAWSGQGTYRGVASSYLAHARPGMKIAVTARPSQGGFHPPESLATPMIMVGAGTGIAPFRGFLQERALRVAETPHDPLADALLFFGCDHPDIDFLYRDELTQWEHAGIVRLRPAFFKAPDGDVTFVQHRLWKDRDEVMALLDKDAHIYVCGDGSRMAPVVRETFGRIYQSHMNASSEQVEAWLTDLEKTTRYTQDVF